MKNEIEKKKINPRHDGYIHQSDPNARSCYLSFCRFPKTWALINEIVIFLILNSFIKFKYAVLNYEMGPIQERSERSYSVASE